jgi:hypothetical protein
VRSGCHCAHLLIKRLLNIHPLLAQLQGLILTLFPQVALPGLTRVSLGIENGAEDIDTLIHVLGKIPRPEASSRNRMPVLPQTDVQRQMDDFARAAARRVYTL